MAHTQILYTSIPNLVMNPLETAIVCVCWNLLFSIWDYMKNSRL